MEHQGSLSTMIPDEVLLNTETHEETNAVLTNGSESVPATNDEEITVNQSVPMMTNEGHEKGEGAIEKHTYAPVTSDDTINLNDAASTDEGYGKEDDAMGTDTECDLETNDESITVKQSDPTITAKEHGKDKDAMKSNNDSTPVTNDENIAVDRSDPMMLDKGDGKDDNAMEGDTKCGPATNVENTSGDHSDPEIADKGHGKAEDAIDNDTSSRIYDEQKQSLSVEEQEALDSALEDSLARLMEPGAIDVDDFYNISDTIAQDGIEDTKADDYSAFLDEEFEKDDPDHVTRVTYEHAMSNTTSLPQQTCGVPPDLQALLTTLQAYPTTTETVYTPPPVRSPDSARETKRLSPEQRLNHPDVLRCRFSSDNLMVTNTTAKPSYKGPPSPLRNVKTVPTEEEEATKEDAQQIDQQIYDSVVFEIESPVEEEQPASSHETNPKSSSSSESESGSESEGSGSDSGQDEDEDESVEWEDVVLPVPHDGGRTKDDQDLLIVLEPHVEDRPPSLTDGSTSSSDDEGNVKDEVQLIDDPTIANDEHKPAVTHNAVGGPKPVKPRSRILEMVEAARLTKKLETDPLPFTNIGVVAVEEEEEEIADEECDDYGFGLGKSGAPPPAEGGFVRNALIVGLGITSVVLMRLAASLHKK